MNDWMSAAMAEKKYWPPLPELREGQPLHAQRELLEQPFPDEATKPYAPRGSSGPQLTTIKAMFILERLTDIFGLGGWAFDFEELTHDGQHWATVTHLFVPDGKVTTRFRACGGSRQSGADGRKSAVTDGLTKAASLIGIGIDIFKGSCATEPEPAGGMVAPGAWTPPAQTAAPQPAAVATTQFAAPVATAPAAVAQAPPIVQQAQQVFGPGATVQAQQPQQQQAMAQPAAAPQAPPPATATGGRPMSDKQFIMIVMRMKETQQLAGTREYCDTVVRFICWSSFVGSTPWETFDINMINTKQASNIIDAINANNVVTWVQNYAVFLESSGPAGPVRQQLGAAGQQPTAPPADRIPF